MTFEPGQEELTEICQYLGLGDDPDSHATYATEAHRCYRMPNPTKIATTHQDTFCLVANHVECPVFKGEVPARPAAGGTGKATARGSGGARPFGGAAPRGKSPERPLSPTGTRGAPRADRPVLPRPRSGGISIPILTVAFFGLALVVVLAAIVIQNQLSGDDTPAKSETPGALSAAARTSTAAAAAKTAPPGQTPAASGTAGANRSTTPGTSQTPGASTTPGTGTQTPGGKTYVVKSGDFCGTIASANNITVDQLRQANPDINADCSNLQIGQTLKLP